MRGCTFPMAFAVMTALAVLLGIAPASALSVRCHKLCKTDIAACLATIPSPVTCKTLPKTERKGCRKDIKAQRTACMTNALAACHDSAGAECTTSTTTIAATSTTSTSTSTTSTLPSGARFQDGGNGTILDTQTALQWEQKDTSVGSGANSGDLHDVDNLYSWAGCCNGDCSFTTTHCQPNAGAAATCMALADTGTDLCHECASGTCMVDPKQNGAITTVWDWLNQLNASNFAGHDDWRLPSESGRKPPQSPTKRELEGILVCQFSTCHTDPDIDPIFGPTADSSFGYWSSSADLVSAYAVRFNDGTAIVPLAGYGLHVRAVR